MSTTKSKKIKHLDAGDFADDSMIKAEQGVFQEITPSEIRDTLGVTSAEDYDNGDFIQSDGTNWVGKSVSEMKTLLGLPSKLFISKLTFTNTSFCKSSVLENTFEGNWAFTKDSTGVYILTSPNAISKNLKGYQITIFSPESGINLTWSISSVGNITFNTKNDSDVLTDATTLGVEITIIESSSKTDYYGGAIL